jgi:hypothetical protein
VSWKRANNRRARKKPAYKYKEGKLPQVTWPITEDGEKHTSDLMDRVGEAPVSATGGETAESDHAALTVCDTPKEAEGTAFFEIGDGEAAEASDIENVYDTLGKGTDSPESDWPNDERDSSGREGDPEKDIGSSHPFVCKNKGVLLTARTLALARFISEEAVISTFIIEELCEVYTGWGVESVEPATISSEKLEAIGTEITERIVGLTEDQRSYKPIA